LLPVNQEQELGLFEKRVLRRLFGLKRETR
jgi:hypothetical protein